MVRTSILLAALATALAVTGDAEAQQDLRARYGNADMEISCASAAARPFTRGLLQLHSFDWENARESFGQAAAEDPGCAMAYWGLAMTRYDSLHEAPSPDAVAAARDALRLAAAAPRQTPREAAYIDAAARLFRDSAATTRIERDRAYSAALAAIARRWPEDEEARIFHALSLLALARRGAGPGLIAQAAASLESLFEAYPEHPGVAHYLIHACDDAGDREPCIEAARRYAGIAPLVTHAQHMPSHIFAGLGLWEESNGSNAAALEADPRYYHALMYVVYGQLQLGQWQDARRRIAALERFAASPAADRREQRGLHQVNTWLLLETRDWAAAAEAPMYSDRPLDAAETLYVRGLGAAHTGDFEKAGEASRALESLLEKLDAAAESGLASNALLIRIQVLEIDALVDFGRGDADAAIRRLEDAAALELRPEINRAPPDSGTGIPAAEMWGEALLGAGRPAEAMHAFGLALERTPRRLHSLLGLARAAAEAGDTALARQQYRALLDLLDAADPGFSYVTEARRYLAGDPT